MDARRVLMKILELLVPPLCIACGADAGAAAPLCQGCRATLQGERARPFALAGLDCWAAFGYDGPAGALVRTLKFGGRLQLADVMAAQIAAHAPAAICAGALVPVPMHPAHRRRRGLDHTRVLADALGSRLGLDVAPCLVRRGRATAQVGRGRARRLAGPVGAIAADPDAIPRSRAVLVDDVVTTGATLAACADALRAAGKEDIAALVYARTTAR